MTALHGLLLAAGEGRRFGGPKALLRNVARRMSFAEHAVSVLIDGGCDGVTVVVGAAEERVRALLADQPVEIITCPTWRLGMGESLRTGLAALGSHESPPDAALVHLVDLPDVGPGVVGRMLDHEPAGGWSAVLRRAAYGPGRESIGHPVLLGREHWAGIREVATGDRGARDYLRKNPPELVDMSDLARGRDVDTPSDL